MQECKPSKQQTVAPSSAGCQQGDANLGRCDVAAAGLCDLSIPTARFHGTTDRPKQKLLPCSPSYFSQQNPNVARAASAQRCKTTGEPRARPSLGPWAQRDGTCAFVAFLLSRIVAGWECGDAGPGRDPRGRGAAGRAPGQRRGRDRSEEDPGGRKGGRERARSVTTAVRLSAARALTIVTPSSLAAAGWADRSSAALLLTPASVRDPGASSATTPP